MKNRVTMLQDSVTAEVTASRPDRRKWMFVRPDEDGSIMLVEFEHLVGLDPDGWPAPEDILDRVQTNYDSLDSLLAALVLRGIDTDAFDAPWKMDYPL